MDEPFSTTTPAAPAALRPPLGLPTGSVRAVLALILCATMWYLVYLGEAVPGLLASAVLLVVAFYFGVRSTASPLPAVAPGQAPGVPPPPSLPPRPAPTIPLL